MSDDKPEIFDDIFDALEKSVFIKRVSDLETLSMAQTKSLHSMASLVREQSRVIVELHSAVSKLLDALSQALPEPIEPTEPSDEPPSGNLN